MMTTKILRSARRTANYYTIKLLYTIIHIPLFPFVPAKKIKFNCLYTSYVLISQQMHI